MSAKNFSFVTETPNVDSNEGTKTDSGTGLKKVITKAGEISKDDSGCNSPELTKLSDVDERTKAYSGSGSLALKTVSTTKADDESTKADSGSPVLTKVSTTKADDESTKADSGSPVLTKVSTTKADDESTNADFGSPMLTKVSTTKADDESTEADSGSPGLTKIPGSSSRETEVQLLNYLLFHTWVVTILHLDFTVAKG
ncbi:Uncharacterized protein Rs2_04735 [Raphanus sativus]|nr:Uncharacterized protein Rs2_04735 [Raphanus sativus]